ncbi:hypothetical protein K7432_013399 [Basidiobolus ranarum]|uniref:Uncharacterized protein n=1 Tax=Basidiobolus ranarum TaxID=34480 RepID=A0ABR2WJD5_9FUNG
MSEYDTVIRGSLKLKGSNVCRLGGGVKKRVQNKHKHPTVSASLPSKDLAAAKPTKTPAELAFEKVQRIRQREKAYKLAQKSHKQKVAEFNEYLANISEHYDIPKVGPG